MTGIGNLYGGALYSLAQEEGLSKTLWEQLKVLDACFRQEPGFLRILSAPTIPKAERCRILEESFRGKVEPYLLSFLKLLTEKGYIRHFSVCCDAYRELYYQASGILPVTAVSAAALSGRQLAVLTKHLNRITGKHVVLENRTDPAVLGGICLDYDGKRADGTLRHRLQAIRSILHSTADSQKAGKPWS